MGIKKMNIDAVAKAIAVNMGESLPDLPQALKEAKAENRPLLVWLAGGRDRDGSPLERC